ncbi:hypothetical protein KSP35_02495 [Aquihabitans sp. G128]|uniref:hypothetical protein n=1 Tax=Aquihabitans sp. G128 TaxID=2849779 RepID=UPI001C21E314|nr:hypothetical protein [Aquihabitans sp. G128]QXC61734.1 hypothetical protein KSP35_02495 [Aquihabitans sp. G128]
MCAGLLVTGAAGCSSSGSDKASDKTEAVSTNDGGEGSGNADVTAYCKAVDSFVKKAKAAQGDAAKAQALTADSQDLAKKAQALATANLSADDAQVVADCTKKSTDALMPG